MLTEEIFRTNSYLKECEAEVISVNELGGIVLNRSVFYPTGGGQPGDSGILCLSNGSEINIATTVKGKGTENVVHVPAEAQLVLEPGAKVTAIVDWDRRYKHMQMHTALHLMCSVVSAGVTGNQIGTEKSRMDFDMGDEKLDKDEIAAFVKRFIFFFIPTSIS